MKSVYAYDYTGNSIRKLNNELTQGGWSIYQPIKQGNIIHLFHGGEEDFPPLHVIYNLN